jgi:hypothetical protein
MTGATTYYKGPDFKLSTRLNILKRILTWFEISPGQTYFSGLAGA